MNEQSRFIKQMRKIASIILFSKMSRGFSDKFYVRISYFSKTGKFLKLNNPQTFNEKLQWLKIYNQIPLYHKLVDKAEVKDVVSKIIGNQYIIKTLGIWDRFEDINFDDLPNNFVIKCTHDSGSVVVCKDKRTLDYNFLKSKIENSLSKDYWKFSREWVYKDVKPRVIVEEYMQDLELKEARDYKLLCFNGKVKMIEQDTGRFNKLYMNYFDTNWNAMNFYDVEFPPDNEHIFEKPPRLNEMINIAEKLSKNIPYVRIDLYNINNNIYFGEMTFYHNSGVTIWSEKGVDELIGSWLELPKVKTRE